MARIEAGLVLLDVDFRSSRFAWTDADKTTPFELGLGWMLRNLAADDRAFIGRDAIERAGDEVIALEAERPGRRLARLRPHLQRGRAHPAEGPHAGPGRVLRLRRRPQPARLRDEQMYSPMLQRHIALARVPLDRTAPGSRVKLELAVTTATSTSTPTWPGPPLQPRAKDRLTCRRPQRRPAAASRPGEGHLEGGPHLRRHRRGGGGTTA